MPSIAKSKKISPSYGKTGVKISITPMCGCTFKPYPHEHDRDKQGNEVWNWAKTRQAWGIKEDDVKAKDIANKHR